MIRNIGRTEICIFFGQVIVIILWGLFLYFDPENSRASTPRENEVKSGVLLMQHYPSYLDVHVMIFVGFGFLMVFLKSYSWSAIAINYFIAAWSFQVCVLTTVFWNDVCSKYVTHQNNPFSNGFIDIKNLVFIAEFGIGSVLITMGALLGKCNILQLWIIATIEVCFYSLNNAVLTSVFYAKDLGGSMTIHQFGGYFGLAASFFFRPKKAKEDEKTSHQNGGSYYSNYIAMIGTLFLFIYWPSFNGGPGENAIQQFRGIINTLLSITTSVISAMWISRVLKNKQCDMEIMLNATLAGGVVMGAPCDMVNYPFCAMIIGFSVGLLSAVGFAVIGPFLKDKINLHDTCGIHNLHAMPGFLGGIISAIAASKQAQGPGRFYNQYYNFFLRSDTRTPAEQAGYQLAGVAFTLGIAIVTGLLAGFIASLSIFQPPSVLFDDRDNCTDVKHPKINENHQEFGEKSKLVVPSESDAPVNQSHKDGYAEVSNREEGMETQRDGNKV